MQSIKMMQTAIPNLDALLGGGIPVYSLNILAGQPGCRQNDTLAANTVQLCASAYAGPCALSWHALGTSHENCAVYAPFCLL